MKIRWKWVLWLTPILCILVVVLGIMADTAHVRRESQEPMQMLSSVIQEIETHGLSDKVPALLAEAPRPKDFYAYYIMTADADWTGIPHPAGKILAAYPAALVGHTEGEGPWPTTTADGLRPGTLQFNPIPVKAPDGTLYAVAYMHGPRSQRGVFDPLVPWILGLGWVGLALGTFLDAREHGSSTAWAWLLLSLVTGPAGLAAWLITRSTMPSRKTSPCPGCGADTVRGTAFCVRCGHALQPCCPDCRRPVELDWSYCGTCGRDLAQ